MLEVDASTIATVGALRLATSSRVSASLMLLLSWPSLKSTIKLAPAGRHRRREGNGKAVEDGAAAGGHDRGERRVGGRRRIGEIDEPADAHVERDEPQPVARAEVGFAVAAAIGADSSRTGPVTLALTSRRTVTSIGSFS